MCQWIGNRRQILAAAGGTALGAALGSPLLAKQRTRQLPAQAAGEGMLPDTLDLADRGLLAQRALTGALDYENDYELYFIALFFRKPAVMYHEGTGLPTNNPKFAESQALVRLMSGSDYNLEIQRNMLRAMVRNIHDDGLYYSPTTRRPWSHDSAASAGGAPPLPFANVYGNARFLLAMMALTHVDGDSAWDPRMKGIADGLTRIAIDKGEYAFYPVGKGVGETYSWTTEGWRDTAEPTDGDFGVPMYYSGVIRALTAWSRLTGNRQALSTAGKLAQFVRRPFVWTPATAIEATQDASGRGHCRGHFHAHAAALRGLLAYAMAVEDADLLRFVNDGYQWLCNFSLPRLGWFPENLKSGQHCETCCTADMIPLAIRLSDAGVGDYWDDVDRAVRNQLVEQQLTNAKYLEELSARAPKPAVTRAGMCTDRVIERNIGGFVGHGELTFLPKTWIMHCCTGNATPALYYAWESIVRGQGETATVNLLLNRESPWLRVESWLPYEGRVRIVNHKARRVRIRVPLWVNPAQVQCQLAGRPVVPERFGRYLGFENLSPGDVVTLELPLQNRVERFSFNGQEFAAELRGNTVVDLTPRQQGDGYPIYEREAMKKGPAPMVRKQLHQVESPMTWV